MQHNQLLAQQLAFVNLFFHSSTSFILSPSPVHEHGLQQHEKARKLHWTLYGWASLAHCGLKLLVSTVQMIILLQFNNAEVRSGCKGQVQRSEEPFVFMDYTFYIILLHAL